MDLLDLAAGQLWGVEPGFEISLASREDPLLVLDAVVLPALQRPPCVVSFSGGCDSSSVLAVATHVARREGLPLPIPTTLEFTGVASTVESDHQREVIEHLRLTDWERIRPEASLHLLGDVALDPMRRHGLMYPLNTHFHAPILERARGGSLLTGAGGDQVLATHRWRTAARLRAGQTRASARRLRHLAAVSTPLGRRLWSYRNVDVDRPWLTPAGNRELRRRVGDEYAMSSVDYRAYLTEVVMRQRGTRQAVRSLDLLAADYDVHSVHPFADQRFGAALAGLGGPTGLRDRQENLEVIVGDLLPTSILERRTKATFDGVFWTEQTAALAAQLPVEQLDDSVIDREALLAEWASPRPRAGSFLLAQYLRARQLGLRQAVDGETEI